MAVFGGPDEVESRILGGEAGEDAGVGATERRIEVRGERGDAPEVLLGRGRGHPPVLDDFAVFSGTGDVESVPVGDVGGDGAGDEAGAAEFLGEVGLDPGAAELGDPPGDGEVAVGVDAGEVDAAPRGGVGGDAADEGGSTGDGGEVGGVPFVDAAAGPDGPDVS